MNSNGKKIRTTVTTHKSVSIDLNYAPQSRLCARPHAKSNVLLHPTHDLRCVKNPHQRLKKGDGVIVLATSRGKTAHADMPAVVTQEVSNNLVRGWLGNITDLVTRIETVIEINENQSLSLKMK